MMKRKTYELGGISYLLPFQAGGFWVSDARGTSVLEARSQEVAKALADMMNRQAELAAIEAQYAPKHGGM